MPMPAPTFFEDPIGAARAFFRVNACSYDGDLIITSGSVSMANFCLMAIIVISGLVLGCSFCCIFSGNAKLRPCRAAFMLMALAAILGIVTAFAGFQAVNSATPVTAPA